MVMRRNSCSLSLFFAGMLIEPVTRISKYYAQILIGDGISSLLGKLVILILLLVIPSYWPQKGQFIIAEKVSSLLQ